MVVEDFRVVSRHTFLELEVCTFHEAVKHSDKQKWGDMESDCDTVSVNDFEDLSEDLSEEEESSTGQACSPPGIFSTRPGIFSTTAFLPTSSQRPESKTDRPQMLVHSLEEVRTTIIIKNIGQGTTSMSLARLLDATGFWGLYDFVYVPCDFQGGACFGYAFINMLTAKDAVDLMNNNKLQVLADVKELELDWGLQQGLSLQIEKYRNSPLMYESVYPDVRPLVFVNGANIAFPAPTKVIKRPRVSRGWQVA